MELARRKVLKERNPWLTPTESCESDETEDEEVTPFMAPPVLPDPLAEEMRIREPKFGCQTGESGVLPALEVQTNEGHKAV